MVEMLARTGKKISNLLEFLYGITGRLYAIETQVAATPEMRIVIPQRLRAMVDVCDNDLLPCIGPNKVLRLSELDGMKFYMENDNWVLLRFSGTEPVLRLFAEADSMERAWDLVNALKQAVSLQ